MISYRIYTETTTAGVVREVYGIEGGGTGDTYVVEYSVIPAFRKIETVPDTITFFT